MTNSDPSSGEALRDVNGQLVYAGELVTYSGQLSRIEGVDPGTASYPGSTPRTVVWLRIYGRPDRFTCATLEQGEDFEGLLRLTPLEQLAAVAHLCL